MASLIYGNPMALNLANIIGMHYSHLQTSMQRLYTGLRINSAADDAAGLAIRELMRADIAALNQGVRNANDAISLLQTADDALGVIDTQLLRMKELAMQASSSLYTSDQRLIIESEYQTLASEITRIANATDFNGIKLLDGSLSTAHNGSGLESSGALLVQFGSGNSAAEDYYYIQIGNSTASALGLGIGSAENAGYTLSTIEQAQASLEAVDAAIVSKDSIRGYLGSMQNRLEATVSSLTVQSENLTAAESRISDADIAAEMTTFVRNQILAQTAVAMLGQANTTPRLALNLLL